MEAFERDDYPFPNQCVAIITPQSEAKSRRCGKVANTHIADLFPVCSTHREYLDNDMFDSSVADLLQAQARRIEELEKNLRNTRGNEAEWRRLAQAKHGDLAGKAYKPVAAKDSFVYFIQGGDYIKIGKANNPIARFAQLQLGGVIMPQGVKHSDIKIVGIERGGHERETELHHQFASLRVAGEWFHADETLVSYIRGLPATSSPQWGDEGSNQAVFAVSAGSYTLGTKDLVPCK